MNKNEEVWGEREIFRSQIDWLGHQYFLLWKNDRLNESFGLKLSNKMVLNEQIFENDDQVFQNMKLNDASN